MGPAMGTPEIQELIDNEHEALQEMNYNTEVIREAVIDAHEDLDFYNSKKAALIYTFYSVCMAVLLCFVGAFITKQSFYMNISIIVSQVIMVGLIALCSIEMAFMIMLGDFCMEPTESVIDSLDGEDILQRTATFYSRCSGDQGNGDNFIHRALATSYEKRRQLGRALQILYMPPRMLADDIPRDPDVPICERYTIDKNVQDSFYELQALAPDFQGIAASISASVMMLYFDRFWDIAGTNKEKVDSLTSGGADEFAVESDTTESNPVSMGTRSDGY